jgi:hypothetical protein
MTKIDLKRQNESSELASNVYLLRLVRFLISKYYFSSEQLKVGSCQLPPIGISPAGGDI